MLVVTSGRKYHFDKYVLLTCDCTWYRTCHWPSIAFSISLLSILVVFSLSLQTEQSTAHHDVQILFLEGRSLWSFQLLVANNVLPGGQVVELGLVSWVFS